MEVPYGLNRFDFAKRKHQWCASMRRSFKRSSRALLLSAGLHFAIAAAIYALPFMLLDKQKKLIRPEPLVLDLRESPKKAQPSHGSVSLKRSRKTGVNKSSRPTLKSISPSFKPSYGTDVAIAQSDGSSEAPALDDPQSYGFNAKTYDKGNAIRGFLEALHSRVNNALVFDSILAQYNHFGTVYLQFEVDKRGTLRIETLRASTTDRILKVHVIRSALVPALREPLKESFWLTGRETIQLRARFQFVRSRKQTTLWDDNPETISGYSLTFRRFTPERAVPRTLGDHLVNGGIDSDLFAMYEAWQKFNKARERRRLDVDPFAVYKADPMY